MNNRKYNVSRETLFLPFKVVLLSLVSLLILSPSLAAIETVSGLTTDNYLLVDFDSEMILAGENYDEVMGIASITKLMSYTVYMDKVNAEQIDIDTTMIPVSDQIVDVFAKNSDLSGVYFEYGSEYSLREMFDLMMVYSDNGATKAIGEYLFGTEELAVEQMNAKAKELGLEQTTYYNTTGLTMGDYKQAKLENTKETDYNKSTAREQIMLAKYIVTNYPELLDIVGKSYIDFEGYPLMSFNLMLSGLDYEYPGVKGLKTGSSLEAGYSFVGYYVDPATEKEYLSIVLNSDTDMKRFNDTTYLYNWLSDTEMQTLMLKDQQMEMKIKGATKSIYTVQTNAEYQIPQGTTLNLERQSFEYNPEYFDANNKLIKDIPTGAIVGSYVYTVAEEEVTTNYFESLEASPNVVKIQVASTEDIPQEGFIGAIFTGITDFFVNVFESM